MIKAVAIACSLLLFVQSDIGQIQNTDWVLVGYVDPLSFEEKALRTDQYQDGCTFKYVIRFMSRGKMTINANDKWNFKGTYESPGDQVLSIRANINLNVVDLDQQCTITTESRIVIKEILDHVSGFTTGIDTLTLRYIKKQKTGFAKFVKYKSK